MDHEVKLGDVRTFYRVDKLKIREVKAECVGHLPDGTAVWLDHYYGVFAARGEQGAAPFSFGAAPRTANGYFETTEEACAWLRYWAEVCVVHEQWIRRQVEKEIERALGEAAR